MQYLVKLVRDRISDNVLGSGAKLERIKDDAEFEKKLKEKLSEEVAEYLLEPSLSELGDIYEVIRTLAVVSHGAVQGDAAIAIAATEKRSKRGGFSGRTGLYIEEKESYV